MRAFFNTYRPLIWMLPFLVLLACSKEREKKKHVAPETTDYALVAYIEDIEHPLSHKYCDNIAKVMDYTNIPFKRISINDFDDSPNLGEHIKVLLINGTEKLHDQAINYLIGFVAKGGTLIFPSANEDQRLGYLSGLRADASFDYDLKAKGIHFIKNILPGLDEGSIYSKKIHIGLAKENFKPNINVLATAMSDDELPILLENKVGNGRVVHFNTTIDFEKTDRGLLFSTILSGLEGIPYPIVNVSTIFIDDFPGPVYDIDLEPIKSELGVSEAEYVLDVWWPDMVKVSERFGIDYSAYIIFNYNVIKTPPFLFNEWDLNKTVRNNKPILSTLWLTKQVLNHGYELALHGYNHESFLKEVWANPESIEESLVAVRKKWAINRFGKYPRSYVAPSNYIDSIGVVRLKRGLPELQFMSTTYEGDVAEGGDRDFDPDPYEPKLFDFPRVTSGYLFNDQKEYTHESLYLYTGIWPHFIHPDDVFQIPDPENTSAGDFEYRNKEGLGWYTSPNGEKGLLDHWIDYLEKVKRIHPSTRFLNVSEGATITRDWRNTTYKYSKTGDFYSVEKTSKNKWKVPEYYWFMFSSARNAKAMEAKIKEVAVSYNVTDFFGGKLFNVRTDESFLKFENDAQFKSPTLFGSEVTAMVMDAFIEYNEQRVLSGTLTGEEVGLLVEDYQEVAPKLENSEDSVAYFVANENLAQATDILLNKLNKESSLDSSAFADYVLYLAYQEKSEKVWSFLDTMYQVGNKQLAYAYLADYLSQEAFPTEETTEKWLWRKIQDNPADSVSVKEYITYFYGPDNKEKVKQAVEGLYKAIPTEINYALFIQYLIDFEPETLTVELQGKRPEQYPLLWPKATTITYAFSDEGKPQEALLWSDYSKEIPINTRLQWWIDLEAFNKMQSVYEAYNAENPSDYSATAFISKAWYDIGEYERSAILAQELPENADKEEFRDKFNPDVLFFEPDVQKFLIDRTPDLFTYDAMHAVVKELRINGNSSVEYNTAFVEDNFNQSVWENSVAYNLRTQKGNQHTFSITHAEVSDLVLNEFDPKNIAHSLYGLKYRYQTANHPTKPLFYIEGGLSQNEENQTFFSFESSVSKSIENVFKSLTLTMAPVMTGPAISKEIYKSEMVGYYERGSTKFLQSSFALVGSYYTNGGFEGALTAKAYANFKKENKSRFAPYAEGFASVSNTNNENGNPYWIVNNHFYGGGGLAWIYGKDERKLKVRLEAGYFVDSYTGNFMRYNGTISLPIKEFTYLTGQFEIFNQSLYFSNGIQFGIKYYLDRRKYSYKPRNY